MDKLISSKLEGYEAPYNPGDWQRMEHMLNCDGGKVLYMGLPKMAFIAASIIFLLLFGSFGVFKLVNMASTVSPDMAQMQVKGWQHSQFSPLNIEITAPPEEVVEETAPVKIQPSPVAPPAEWAPEYQDMEKMNSYAHISLLESANLKMVEANPHLGYQNLRDPGPYTDLSVGITGGPEINHVSKAALDYSFGFAVEYKLNKNLGISSGLGYGRKTYNEGRSNISFPDSSQQVSHTSAELSLLEMPLDLKLYFNNNRKVQSFISAGISAFIPLKESYTFSYDPGFPTGSNNQSIKSSTMEYVFLSEGQKSNNFTMADALNERNQPVSERILSPFIGSVNLSAGLRFTPSYWVNIDLAPFIKIPVKGFGLEKRRIKTYGLNVTLSHNI